jgi:hypothetical protein
MSSVHHLAVIGTLAKLFAPVHYTVESDYVEVKRRDNIAWRWLSVCVYTV